MEPFQYLPHPNPTIAAGSLYHIYRNYSLDLTSLVLIDSEGRPLFSRAFAVVLISKPPHTCGSIGCAAGCGAGCGLDGGFVSSLAIAKYICIKLLKILFQGCI
jgi:hypothetical protein